MSEINEKRICALVGPIVTDWLVVCIKWHYETLLALCLKIQNTVNVWKPNVLFSDSTEIRTKACSNWLCWTFRPELCCSVPNPPNGQKRPKSEWPSGFQTQIYQFTCVCLKSRHFVPFSYMCSDSGHKSVSEIRTICSDLRQPRPFGGDCLKSGHVRISDIYCTE